MGKEWKMDEIKKWNTYRREQTQAQVQRKPMKYTHKPGEECEEWRHIGN